MISIDEYVVWVRELIESISLSIATCNYCSLRLISSSISSHFMFFYVSDIERSILIHCHTYTIDVGDDCFSICSISTRPSNHSSIPIITYDETICFFVNNHILRVRQLMISISLSMSTGNHLTTRRCTPFPFHNTMIVLISDIDRLIIINIQTTWIRELIDSIALLISSSYSDTILFPSSIWMNDCS